jgi:hypothetical protein
MPGKGYADLFLRRLSSLMEMTAFEAGTGGAHKRFADLDKFSYVSIGA